LAPLYSFARYLTAKKTVDDRALNQGVIERLRRELGASRPTVLELGAGVGSMVTRLIDWGILHTARYRLLEMDGTLLEDARPYLEHWAHERGYRVDARTSGIGILGDGGLDVEVEFQLADVTEYLERTDRPDGTDLLIANAFLDLVDLPTTTNRLLTGPSAPRLFWFSINFDGETIFEPAHEHDAALLAVYHRSMDDRTRAGRPAGDSRAGRHLFAHLRAAGAELLAAGSSDWVVWPERGRYPADEAHFLHHIIETIDQELRRHADVAPVLLSEWAALRHSQIDRGELVYLAHQLDFLGRPRRTATQPDPG
jgi:hypothetical protein